MKMIFAAAVAVSMGAAPAPANAYWNCTGLLTSNNVCIGSESNVDSRNNHEPITTDRRDFVLPNVVGGHRRSTRDAK
jgi:hypothetical protein